MASFHSHTQIISRSGGRSSVAAAAYRSGQKLTNERDGITHDYSQKHGVVHCEIVLPEAAPARWLDRSTLWNEVEATEKQANAQLAREINYALPVELTRDEQIAHAREYAQYFADMGMVVDFAIHDTDGTNPHVHMMLTMRPCNEDGFTAKTKSAYLVRNSMGDERMADAEEFKQLKEEGFEKVYTYRLGNEYRKLTPTQAQEWDGCKRVGKNPEKEKVALASWLEYREEGQLDVWRAKLAEIQNRFLSEAGHSARVDHRSYAERGIEQIPQRHEGVQVKNIEQKAERLAVRQGVEYQPVTEVRRENIAIAKANEVIAQARAAWVQLGQQVREAGQQAAAYGHDLAGRLVQEMGQWRDSMETTLQKLFQPRQIASAAVSNQTQGIYRVQADTRLETYRERLTDPSYRLHGNHILRIRTKDVHRDLTEREQSFLTPTQQAAYRSTRSAEVAQAKRELERARRSRSRDDGWSQSSSSPSRSHSAPSQSRGRSR